MWKGFIRFNQGVLGMPAHWKVWLMLLMAANAVAPVFFLQHREAQVVLGTFLVSAGLMTALTARSGFTRILGLGHFLWFPLIAFIVRRFEHWPVETPVGLWLRCLVTLNAVSLLIDVTDVVRFVRGDRSETVDLPDGLPTLASLPGENDVTHG
ncbi:hypothetical protein GC176_12110 [bacterium]|nr:hypothetical protein [bacterium]